MFLASMPKRIQVFEDTVYVMTYDQKVMTFNKFASTDGNLLLDGTHRASDILILQPLKQKRNSKSSFVAVMFVDRGKSFVISFVHF